MEGVERVREHEHIQIKAAASVEEVGRASAWWGTQLRHGGHVSYTHRLLGHFPEHVAGNGVASVGGNFGLVMGRIGPWAQKQS